MITTLQALKKEQLKLEAEANDLRNDITGKEFTIKNKEKDREVKRQAIRNEQAEQSEKIA